MIKQKQTHKSKTLYKELDMCILLYETIIKHQTLIISHTYMEWMDEGKTEGRSKEKLNKLLQ